MLQRILEPEVMDSAEEARDYDAMDHAAVNRTFALYRELQAAAAPLGVPRLTLDTGTLSLPECVRRCLDYLGTA